MISLFFNDVVADKSRGYGGTILHTTLSKGRQAKVEKILAGGAKDEGAFVGEDQIA